MKEFYDKFFLSETDLRLVSSRKYSTVFSGNLLSRKEPSKMFDRALNTSLEYSHFVYIVQDQCVAVIRLLLKIWMNPRFWGSWFIVCLYFHNFKKCLRPYFLLLVCCLFVCLFVLLFVCLFVCLFFSFFCWTYYSYKTGLYN